MLEQTRGRDVQETSQAVAVAGQLPRPLNKSAVLRARDGTDSACLRNHICAACLSLSEARRAGWSRDWRS